MPLPDIDVARAYAKADGSRARLLVDRVWPRVVPKENLRHDDWIRDVAPSSDLRKWFGHDPAKWDEFRERYRKELDDNRAPVERRLDWCRKAAVTLNQAVVLRDYLMGRMEDR